MLDDAASRLSSDGEWSDLDSRTRDELGVCCDSSAALNASSRAAMAVAVEINERGFTAEDRVELESPHSNFEQRALIWKPVPTGPTWNFRSLFCFRLVVGSAQDYWTSKYHNPLVKIQQTLQFVYRKTTCARPP